MSAEPAVVNPPQQYSFAVQLAALPGKPPVTLNYIGVNIEAAVAKARQAVVGEIVQVRRGEAIAG